MCKAGPKYLHSSQTATNGKACISIDCKQHSPWLYLAVTGVSLLVLGWYYRPSISKYRWARALLALLHEQSFSGRRKPPQSVYVLSRWMWVRKKTPGELKCCHRYLKSLFSEQPPSLEDSTDPHQLTSAKLEGFTTSTLKTLYCCFWDLWHPGWALCPEFVRYVYIKKEVV